MSNKNYFAKIKPYAEKASAQTGIPTSIIMGQWALETGYGTSRISKDGIYNHGGIKWTEGRSPYQASQTGMYAKYSSMNNFVNDYVRVMNLSFYDKVRQATGFDNILNALDKSPYAEGKNYNTKIKSIIATYNLDNISSNPSTPDIPSIPNIPSLESLSDDQVKTYATAGVLLLSAIALLSD